MTLSRAPPSNNPGSCNSVLILLQSHAVLFPWLVCNARDLPVPEVDGTLAQFNPSKPPSMQFRRGSGASYGEGSLSVGSSFTTSQGLIARTSTARSRDRREQRLEKATSHLREESPHERTRSASSIS